jgi:hypothetical protein
MERLLATPTIRKRLSCKNPMERFLGGVIKKKRG